MNNEYCNHGISFDVECERCEMNGIIESLKWMKRRVLKDEKRLKELDEKYTPEMFKNRGQDNGRSNT